MSCIPRTEADTEDRETAFFAVPPEGAELATFFDVSLDLLVIRDITGRVVRVSPSWNHVLGYTPEEMQGVALLTLVHPEDLPGTQGSVREVEKPATGRSGSGPYQSLSPQGRDLSHHRVAGAAVRGPHLRRRPRRHRPGRRRAGPDRGQGVSGGREHRQVRIPRQYEP
jgi:PAS domain-containing protein